MGDLVVVYPIQKPDCWPFVGCLRSWKYRGAWCAIRLLPNKNGHKQWYYTGYAAFSSDILGVGRNGRLNIDAFYLVRCPGGLSYSRDLESGEWAYGYDRCHLWDDEQGMDDTACEWQLNNEQRVVEEMVDSIIEAAAALKAVRQDG